MLDTVFLRILDMTRTGSMVILGVLLARVLLKRAPKVFSYALWAVVLFRLLCPVSFEAPVSLLPEAEPVAQSYDLSQEAISVAGAGMAAYQLVGDAINGGLGIQHVPTTERDAWGNVQYVTTDWWNVVLLFGQYLWLAGVAGLLLYGLISYGKLRGKLKTAIPLQQQIYLADGIGSPFVIGFLRPRIYLPEGLEKKEREYILLHERAHIRRGDPLIKLLAWLALCLHWFNPLVWLAFTLACKDMEMSCDEAVLKKMGEAVRADYAASLLSLATGRRIIAGVPLAFGEGDPKVRIKNLAKWKKPALWVILAAGIGCITLGICLITDPASGEEDTLMGANYSVGEILYDVTEGERDNFQKISVTADYQLYRQKAGADYWLSGRDMESYPLTVKELKQYTGVDSGWKENYRIGKISDAYIVRMENDYFYLVFRTKRGDTLLGFGWEDVSERDDPGSDDTNLRWLCRLEPETAAQKQRLTLADVLDLSQLGENLTWEDLAGFEYEDVGSGLYICRYPIDEAYTLQVTDGKRNGSPMQAVLVSNHTGIFRDIRTGNISSFITSHRDSARTMMIEAAIAQQNAKEKPDGLIFTSSHLVLGEETAIATPFLGSGHRVTQETVYLLVMQQRYRIESNMPQAVSGSCGAVAITFDVDEAGQYRVSEYWEPREGSYYSKDIRARFPGAAAEMALNDQQYLDKLESDCYEKACAYISPRNSLRERIGILFVEVSASPAQYSMPGPYIEAHPEQWQELISYGSTTLEYCFSEFTASGQKGLLELLMALACEEILKGMGEQDFPAVEGHGTGSQWFNHFAEYAQLLIQNEEKEEVEKFHPGAWLYLQMRGWV